MREILADLRTVLFWTLIGLIALFAVLAGLLLWHGYADLGTWLHLF